MNYIDDLIDYLIEDGAADTCSKCIYNVEENEYDGNGNPVKVTRCIKNKSCSADSICCRTGMKEYFKQAATAN